METVNAGETTNASLTATKESNETVKSNQHNNNVIDENKEITVKPNISVHAGPAPKRNVAIKKTFALVNKTNNNVETTGGNNKPVSIVATVAPPPPSKSQFTAGNIERLDSNSKEKQIIESDDEYIPPKNYRETSDYSDSDNSVDTRTKHTLSTRTTKRQKTQDESSNDSSSTALAVASPQLTHNQLQQSSIQIQKQLKPATLTNTTSSSTSVQVESGSKPRQFARKSTAPMPSAILSIQSPSQQQQPSSVQAVKTSVITPTVLTSVQPQSTSKITIYKQQQQQPTPFNGTTSSATKPAVSTSSCTSQPKQMKNKIVSCKPFYQTKGTECHPIMRDQSTQIDLDEIKLSHTVVPVPVPINVPLPMCMYQAPMPVPLFIPVPVLVPVLIPTTKKTYDRVHRKIKKLRAKLPSDPYEFELLLYAEKLAREEGIPGYESSSDGESDPEEEVKSKRTSTRADSTGQKLFINQDNSINQQLQQASMKTNEHESTTAPTEAEGAFKWNIGVKIFNAWLSAKLDQLATPIITNSQRLPNDLLKLKNDELNSLLAEFIKEVRKPNGEAYAPESIYYICLGIQYYLQDKGRVENIFLDASLFELFQEAFNETAMRYKIRIDANGLVTSRIEEEILWESKQLGAYSPFVLLNTILYFNTKYFFLDKVEAHKKLSFTNVKKHSKRNIGVNGEDYGKTVFLRYYPEFHGQEQVIYEQGENFDNPLRCPVELYNFYLSKCPENVKNRNDVFYLLPEKASLPSSPVWFSSQPLSDKMLDRMLNRIKMVKEVNELLLAAGPATTSFLIQ